MEINEVPEKYKTCDWVRNYESIGLTKEHIKRLNNAINILESLNEPTDVKYLKEIKDKLLEVNEVEEVDLKKEYDDFQDLTLVRLVNRNAGMVIAKHFFDLGLKVVQKGK